jgi:hypothetical protein
MLLVVCLSAYMQRFVHPIRAIVFGANVLPITRGVSGPRQTVELELEDRVEFNRDIWCQHLCTPAGQLLQPHEAGTRRRRHRHDRNPPLNAETE